MEKIKEKYINEHSRFMEINGMQIHYRDEECRNRESISSDTYPLLLLHGALSSLHTFDSWTQELSNDFRIIRLDLPGFGLTGHITNAEYTKSVYMTCLQTLLNELQVERCNIAGSSLGGWIAWEFALEYPERINKMILIDAAGYIKRKDYPLPFKMAQTPFINKFIKYVATRKLIERFLKEVYYDQQKITEELIERYYELFLMDGNQEAFITIANTKFDRNTDAIKNIKSPTLILWGEADTWVPVEHGYRFKNDIPNSTLILYENVGHVPMDEIPEQSAMDVKSFLLSNTVKK
ncbi:MAG: alpha/beta hydrolase [Bacteroidota bacterium]